MNYIDGQLVPQDLWFVISQFLHLDFLLVLGLFGNALFSEDSVVYKVYYQNEIACRRQQNYKASLATVLPKILNLDAQQLLTYGSEKGYLPLVEKALTMGAVLVTQNPLVLWETIDKGYLSIFKVLLHRFAEQIEGSTDLSILRNISGQEILFDLLQRALRRGRLEMIEILFEKWPAYYEARKSSIKLPRSLASLQVIKFFATYNDQIIKNGNYEFLIISSEMGRLDIVRFFIENYSDIPEATIECALSWAAFEGHLEVLEYLINHAREDNIYKCLETVICHDGRENLDVFQFLLELQPENIEKRDHRLLRIAKKHSNFAIYDYLISKGADPAFL